MAKANQKPFIKMTIVKKRDGTLDYIKVTTAVTTPGKLVMTGEQWSDEYMDYLGKQVVKGDLKVIIDSTGGSFASAVGMVDAIRKFVTARKVNVKVLIDGGCGSAATYVAFGLYDMAKFINITDRGYVHIHMPKVYEYQRRDGIWRLIQRMGKRTTIKTFVYLYKKLTGLSKKQILEWMEGGKRFSAKEAVELGFCDKIMSLSEFYAMKE